LKKIDISLIFFNWSIFLNLQTDLKVLRVKIYLFEFFKIFLNKNKLKIIM